MSNTEISTSQSKHRVENELTESQFLPSVYKIGLKDILRGGVNITESHVPFPKTRQLEEWRDFISRVGSTVNLVQLPFRYPQSSGTYMVTERSTAKSLLHRDFKDVDMFRGEKEFFAAFQGHTIFYQSELDEWREARKPLSPYMSPKNMSHYGRSIDTSISNATSTLIQHITNKDVTSSKQFRRFVAQSLLNIHLGAILSEKDIDAIVESFQNFYKYSPAIVLGLDRFKPVHDFVHSKLDLYNQVIQEVLTNTLADDKSSGIMVEFLKQNHDNALDLLHTVFAGQSSLATSLEWITYHLAIDPELQKSLRSTLGTSNHKEAITDFLEDTAQKFPTPTFLLRESLNPIPTDVGSIPTKSTIVVPLFGLHNRGEQGKSSNSMYDLQFSPGLRRCLGRNLSQTVHESYINSLLRKTSDIKCLNNPKQMIGVTVVRPDEEFQFEFKNE